MVEGQAGRSPRSTDLVNIIAKQPAIRKAKPTFFPVSPIHTRVEIWPTRLTLTFLFFLMPDFRTLIERVQLPRRELLVASEDLKNGLGRELRMKSIKPFAEARACTGCC